MRGDDYEFLGLPDIDETHKANLSQGGAYHNILSSKAHTIIRRRIEGVIGRLRYKYNDNPTIAFYLMFFAVFLWRAAGYDKESFIAQCESWFKWHDRGRADYKIQPPKTKASRRNVKKYEKT